jgi:hypothetical protein
MKPPRTISTQVPIDAFNQTVVEKSGLWELGDRQSRVLGQRTDTPDNEKWSGRWESNPHGRRFFS